MDDEAADKGSLGTEQIKIKAIIDAVPIGIAVVDNTGKFVEINEAMRKIWGGVTPLPEGAEEYISYQGWWSNTGEMLKPEDWPHARVFRTGKPVYELAIDIEGADGTRGSILASGEPLRDEYGHITNVIITMQDITHHMELLHTLERSFEETRQVSKKSEALESVVEAGIEASPEYHTVLSNLAERMANTLGMRSCTILALDEKTREFIGEAAYNNPRAFEFRVPANHGIVGEIYRYHRTISLKDIQEISSAKNRYLRHPDTRTLLGTPLISHGKLMGIAYMDTETVREFSEEEIRLFELMAGRTASIIENAKLYRSQKEIQDALNRELQSSNLLQRALLPEKPTVAPGYNVAHTYMAGTGTSGIGGDFYDTFSTEEGKVGILIGDVSGKGLEAAALAAATRSTVRAFAYESSLPGGSLSHTNDVLVGQGQDFGVFVTVFLIILDPSTGEFRYSNSGHPPAAIYHNDGSLEFLNVHNAILGILGKLEYQEGSGQLCPGEKLILYTDGISEARHNSELFGAEQLEKVLTQQGSKSPNNLVGELFNAANTWAEGLITDDVAILIVERIADT